jgi:hypothetical protein
MKSYFLLNEFLLEIHHNKLMILMKVIYDLSFDLKKIKNKELLKIHILL